jgi:zinc carboxypeptidase
MRPLPLLLALTLLAATPAAASASPAPTPESFLGHPVGADRKLADWSQITRYFETLDQASERVSLQRLGKSTLGKPMWMALISSAANLRDADRHRATARRLADPRGLTAEQAESLIGQGKVMLLVTCNIHSSEIGASQMAMEWAHQLATSEDPEVGRWLDDVILLLMPSINPDGTDMIVDYYRKYLGTAWEGGRLPWLYHHYAGHDNNRDWYMLNLEETRVVNRVLHHEWFPQVFLDEHQMGATTPRIFVPPYADPHTPLVHPLQWRINDLVGTHMALRLEQRGKSGVITSYAYDAYWPGGTKNTACLKNVIGLLTEVASARIASPVYVDPGELAGGRKGLPEYRAQMNFPNPWPGGWWRLRDIVDYELIASNSLLETCSRYRGEILRACYEMARDAVRRGDAEPPWAYIVPHDQHDPAAAARMVEILRENGLEAQMAEQPFAAGALGSFEAGSVVLRAAQPYRPFLLEMMERQRYPEVRQGPDTREIYRPYDVTAWTLPLLMGVKWVRAEQPFAASLAPYRASSWAAEAPGEGGAGFVVGASSDHAASLVNRLLAGGVRVERALEPFVAGSQSFAAGDFILPAAAEPLMRRSAGELAVSVHGLGETPIVKRARLRAPRLGIYKSWAASMDEGWTRLVLDRHQFRYTSLDNAAVKRGGLEGRFDVILLPDQEKNVIVEGKPKSDDGPTYFEPLPPPYAGGIGKEGVANLRSFVERGGTLICLTSACDLAIEEFNLPVRDLTAKLKSAEFSVPGSLVNLVVDPSQPLAFGMPERCAAYSTGGPVLGTSIPGANVGRAVVARYAEHADELVASGWAHGTEHMAGRAAIVEARLGKGRVILFGPRVQHRAQTLGTYKFLYNAIWNAAMQELPASGR